MLLPVSQQLTTATTKTPVATVAARARDTPWDMCRAVSAADRTNAYVSDRLQNDDVGQFQVNKM